MLRYRKERPIGRKDGPTEVILLLDASGSMHKRKDETIREINKYLDVLRKDGNRYRLTVKTFNEHLSGLLYNKDIRDCGELEHSEYNCDGWTALLDAVGLTLDDMKYKHHRGGRYAVAPRTLFVVVTDGEENHSRVYGLGEVRGMIESFRSENFQFVFLGDGPSAWEVGSHLGFNISVNTDYSHPLNTENIYKSLTASTVGYASGGTISACSFNTNSSTGMDTAPKTVNLPLQLCTCNAIGAEKCPLHEDA